MSKQFILVLLISMILTSILASGSDIYLRAAPAIIVVPDDYATIQETINGASDGEAIDRSTAVRDYWPTAGWRYSSAEEQGMNSTKLEEMMGLIRSEGFSLDSVVIVRNGYVVLEEYPRPDFYNQNTTHLLYSATKSVTSMLIGIALGEGYIDNVQHRLVDFFPNRTIANMSSQKQAITLENVLTMSSGLQWDEWTYPPYDPRNSVTRMTRTYDWVQYVLDRPMAHEPGTVWTYNGGGSHLLSAVLNETTGVIAGLYAKEKLFHPLGITQEYWMTDPTGLTLGYTHLFLRPLDMAKLGFLNLNRGVWDGEQIVPAEWVQASTEAYYQVWPESDVYYGYQWWMRPSIGYYWAWGMAGQTIAVIPDYDMVVVFTGSVTDYDPGHYLIQNYILPAATALPIVVPNDFPTIQEAVNNADDGDTVFVKAGTYYEHVVVNKTVSLVGENCTTTIVDGNWTGVVINVTRNDVIVSGLTVRRSGSIYWENAGIFLDNVENCSISENILTENSFAGLELNYSRGCNISGNNIHSNGGVGITLVGGSLNDLSRNSFAENGWSALTLNDNANNNTISENSMTSNNLAVTGHCINLYRSSNNFIHENKIVDDDNGIRLEYWSNFNTISQNNVTNNTQIGVSIERYADNNTIFGNMISGNRFGVVVNGSRYTDIYGNTIAHNYGSDEWDAGVRLESAAYTRIYDNEITDNWRGVLLYVSSPYVSIYGNNVTSNEYGIRVAKGGSSYVNVSGNYVANNRGYGIDVTGFGGGSGSNYATIARNLIVNNTFEAVGLGIGSSYNTVVQNDMIGNGHAGVTLERYSNYNTIVENNIIGNAYGICFDLYEVNSTQNMILNNNIVNNTQQVRIAPGSINAWNGTYPYGGNYWSDHFSWDIFSGPYQNETGSDGIGDAPYEIDENNVDHYPHVPYRLPADINDDAYVGIDDIFLVASNFGKEKGQLGWNPLYDINSNSSVGIDDIYIAASYFGKSA